MFLETLEQKTSLGDKWNNIYCWCYFTTLLHTGSAHLVQNTSVVSSIMIVLLLAKHFFFVFFVFFVTGVRIYYYIDMQYAQLCGSTAQIDFFANITNQYILTLTMKF